MKVLFITPDSALHPILRSQGIPHMKGLKESGINYTILSFEKREQYRHLKDYQQIEELKKELSEYDINWHTIPLGMLRFLPKWAEMNILCLIFSIVLVFWRRINVIHIRGYQVVLTGLTLRILLKVRFIFDMRGLLIEERVLAELWKEGGIYYRLAKFLERCCLRVADSVIVVSEPFAHYIKNMSTSIPVTVIPNCVDLHAFFFNQDVRNKIRTHLNIGNKFVLLYSGSMQVWHSLPKMADFFVALKKEIENAYFLFLSYEHQSEINKMMIDKNISTDDFTVLSVNPKIVPEYLTAGDLAVAITEESIITKVCSPTKFAQYLACGLPVIINKNIGDTQKIIEKYGVGVIIDLDKGWNNEIDKSLNYLNQSQRTILRKRCLKAAREEFRLELAVKKYNKILVSLSN